MIPGQPVPTELDHAAERAAARRARQEAAATTRGHAAGIAPSRDDDGPVVDDDGPVVDPDVTGVVFIHGIGSQAAGETVLAWSAPMIRILSAWRGDRGYFADPVIRARVDLTGLTMPFIELEIEADPVDPVARPAGRWVLTEAWWASDVEAPGVGTMLRWLLWRGEARRILDGIVMGINDAEDARHQDPIDDGPLAALWPLFRWLRDVGERLLILGIFVFLTIVAVPVYAVVKLLSSIPLPTVVQGISTAQLDWFLVDWFGDVRVLLGDRAQAANIRTRAIASIDALREYGCGTVVLVAHSGGTIVGYTTLADMPDDLSVQRFITHGQSLSLAWRLGRFCGPLDRFEPVDGDDDELLRRGDRLVKPLPASVDWHDFWASHDPSPAGPMTDPEACVTLPAGSHPITNRKNVLEDHGSYWDNDEGFVIPVMRLIDTAGKPAGTASRFFPGYGPDDPRIAARAMRVVRLRRFALAWLVLAIATVVTGLLAGPAGFPTLGALILGLPGSLSTPPAPGVGIGPWLVGALAIYILSHGVRRIGMTRWEEWDGESRGLARHDAFVAPGPGSLIVQWAALLVAQFVVAVIAGGGGPLPALLAAYGVLLFIGWMPREWRRRVFVPPPAPAD